MSDSNEVMLARYGERLTFIQEALTQNTLDKKELSTRVEQMFVLLSSIDNRITLLEEKVDDQSPILEEITQLKHEIAGAKKVTRWIWVTLSAMAAFALSIRAELLEIFK